MAKKKSSAENFEYQAEMKQLLHLIVHSLYTHPEIFLRELISNASDALNKIRFRMLTDKDVLDMDADLRMTIEVDEKNQTFSLSDSGLGMTKEDLVNKIGTIASSGTLEFIKQLKEGGKSIDGNVIGQFGVGFYSVFMVAEEVTVETRHADSDSTGYRWISKGENTFTIEEIKKEDRGTKISFKLKDDYKDFSQEMRVKNVIQKYSNFVDFPIFLGKEKVNLVEALWQKSKEYVNEESLNEFYKFISNDYSPPLGHLQLSIEGAVTFKALLFIPETAPMNFHREPIQRNLHLYSNKVFIQDDCKDLLPEYLAFIKGVVDTSDLPLNVSREVTQSSPAMAKIRDVITKKILGYLKTLSTKEPEKFEKFSVNFAPLFKTGVNSDFANRDKIIDLLRFDSSKVEKGKQTSLADYVSRMGEDQKEIYHLSGENREALENNPNLEYFKKNDIEVLLLSDPIDIFIVPGINEYDKKPLISAEKADIDVKKDEDPDKEALNKDLSSSLLGIFKETLGDRIEDVVESKRLVNSAVTLVVGKEGMDAQMEKMMKMMNKDYTGSKKILEVNISHPLIKNLSRMNLADSSDPVMRKCMMQLYDGALLMDGNLQSTSEYVERMTELMENATT